MKHDVQEGDDLPNLSWFMHGEIRPRAEWAPVGQYILIRLPFYRFDVSDWDGLMMDNPEPRWLQRVLFYTRYMLKGREGACGKWRAMEWPA